MNFYCDIKVLPDPEASAPVLISNLISKLHRVLVQLNDHNIGISFPQVQQTLGNTLRLHGTDVSLRCLLETQWLKGLRDYCVVGTVSVVPDNCKYRTVKRKQSKSASNKRKRSIAKGWLSAEEATLKIGDDRHSMLHLPFVQLNSSSTRQTLKLFIDHGKLRDEEIEGQFNTYGLSKTATVPWF